MLASLLRPMGTVLAFLATSGCAYTFTNTHLVRPEGVRTIAVEAVYDTSREVLPHEVLWQSLQDAFAADGHLGLAPQESADALVRAHIKSAEIASVGSNIANSEKRDPSLEGDDGPPAPNKFKVLTQAGEYRDKGRVSNVVEVEVWNLRTRSLIMRHSYAMSDPFQAFHQKLAGVNAANDHLRYDEAVQASFKAISENISRSVVRDLLVK